MPTSSSPRQWNTLGGDHEYGPSGLLPDELRLVDQAWPFRVVQAFAPNPRVIVVPS